MFPQTVDLLKRSDETDEVALNAFMSLAKYTDSQYQNIINYMNSSTYESKQNLMKEAKMEMNNMRAVGDCSKE